MKKENYHYAFNYKGNGKIKYTLSWLDLQITRFTVSYAAYQYGEIEYE